MERVGVEVNTIGSEGGGVITASVHHVVRVPEAEAAQRNAGVIIAVAGEEIDFISY